MRVDVPVRQYDVTAGATVTVAVTITNTSTVIGGYVVRVLGADPGWVDIDESQLSLFPEESRTLFAAITVPVGIASGTRRVAVQVRELTPPEESAIAEIDLIVPAAPAVVMRVDPLSAIGGRRVTYGVLVENAGNTILRGDLQAEDEEGKVKFQYDPQRITLAPGEHVLADLTAKAKRRLLGSPTVRPLSLFINPRSEEPYFDEPFLDADENPQAAPTRPERQVLAQATMIQRAVIGRGAISLLGLLAAVTVFAIVITLALSKLVGQSAADRDLAILVAQARDAGASSGTSGVTGTVTLLTSGKPVNGVSVSVFSVTNSTMAVATTATDPKGGYAVQGLVAGQYKLSFRGAGFVQLWYPGASTDADASVVTLAPDQQRAGLNIAIGGVPATVSGKVVGDDVASATLYLRATPRSPADVNTQSNPVLPDNGNAIVQTVPVGSDGTFTLTNVPSPNRYELVLSKPGFATSTQLIDVGAGEKRAGVQIRLRKGDGVITGSTSTSTGVLGGVTISATSGQTSSSTVSLTDGTPGSFTIRNLPTAASYTIVASKEGYASQTLTVTLAAGQKLRGVAITLNQSSAALRGKVTLKSGGGAAGVAVTITDGRMTLQTQTRSSGDVGSWQAGGLPVPGIYTITFSRPDLASQTLSISLDAVGNVTQGPGVAIITADGIAVQMQSATAIVQGTIKQPNGLTVCPGTVDRLGEATVTLNSGTTTYTVTTASTPIGRCGDYQIEGIIPGTYNFTVNAGPATLPYSQVLELRAGDDVTQSPTLHQPATLSGCVVTDKTVTDCKKVTENQARQGWAVTLYRITEYPRNVLARVRTDSLGAFSFPGVGAGTYIIEAGPAPDNPTTSVTVVLQPSTDTSKIIVVAGGP